VEILEEELGPERPWTYCHDELPPAGQFFEVTRRLPLSGNLWTFAALWAVSRWIDVDGNQRDGIYAWRPKSTPAPLTPEARAYLENRS
jgi:hypothetical protein